MSVAALFASHTPLMDYCAPPAPIAHEVNACLDAVRAWVADYAPDLVVALGPDHFNGFFYQLMPAFCIGTAAESVGDWNTPAGPLLTAPDTAEACARALHAAGVDVALSHRMVVDHGITQLLDQVFDWAQLPPVVPVFVNCAAPPLPPLARVCALGEALGQVLCRFAADESRRVLIAASGGLSHDPPIPRLAEAPEAVRERLIAGGALSAEARAQRQQRVLDDAAGQVAGTSPRTPPDAAWDARVLDYLMARDFDSLCAMDDDDITREGGCGGHELRTWLAAAAAVDAAGVTDFELRYHRAIPEWITGYAVMTAGPAASA